jgi:FkbM family methyltransferase
MSSFNLNYINQYVEKKENLIIFDIGAHNFGDSINMKNNFPNAKVYAFEPDSFNILKYSNLAKQSGVLVFDYAMSDEEGEVIFYNSETMKGKEWSCSGSILKPVTVNGTNEGLHEGLLYNLTGHPVKAITFKSFCDNNQIIPDVVHMDVQGAETKVIKGIGEYRPKIIFAETCEFNVYETNTNLEEFDKLMFSLGYEIVERLPTDTLYIHNDK